VQRETNGAGRRRAEREKGAREDWGAAAEPRDVGARSYRGGRDDVSEEELCGRGRWRGAGREHACGVKRGGGCDGDADPREGEKSWMKK
jgi:hypothetical protein